MRGVSFDGQTNVLGAPRDWDEAAQGPCDALPVRFDPAEGFTSAWELTPDEVAKLYNGGKIGLRIVSGTHPPVALWVE